MKKSILKVFGVVALAAGMLYNVQVSDIENTMDISLVALGDVAAANNEFPWLPPEPEPIGKTRALVRCKYVYPDGSFTSSVKFECFDNYVCIDCPCTPVECGQI